MTILASRTRTGIVRFMGNGIVTVALPRVIEAHQAATVAERAKADLKLTVSAIDCEFRVTHGSDEDALTGFIQVVEIIIGELRLITGNGNYWQCFYMPEVSTEYHRVRATNPDAREAMDNFFR